MTGNSTTVFGSDSGVREEEKGEGGEGERRNSGGGEVGEGKAGSSAAVNLPEVQRVTGEEGEKKIVQVA